MSIEISQIMILKIPRQTIENCWLSVPGWEKLNGTNGYCRDSIRAAQDPGYDPATMKLPYRAYDQESCLLPYEEHLNKLGLRPEDNWILTGARNLGNNLRIIGWDSKKGLLELNGENAGSGREYCCLAKGTDGYLSVERISFRDNSPDLNDIDWAVSGQELVWDGKPAPLEKMIPYTYDLRHIWQIPGELVPDMGPRPYAGNKIVEISDRFVRLSETPPMEAAGLLIDFAKKEKYERETGYLHNAIGISEDGETIINVMRHGSLEDVAATLVNAGAYRAIELDQGGSCGVIMGGSEGFTPGRTLMASQYFRPRGLALLVFGLKEPYIQGSSTLLNPDLWKDNLS